MYHFLLEFIFHFVSFFLFGIAPVETEQNITLFLVVQSVCGNDVVLLRPACMDCKLNQQRNVHMLHFTESFSRKDAETP